ncbi:MAG: aldo/keto reductase [Thermoproteota archaeon]|nr:MAG: aldo/keto reductase [Candidatus Korarchaeota archaeon]
MEYAELGRTGIRVSRVGLGTWQIGTSYWGWGREFTREEAVRVIRTAIELGVNFIDTAELYGGGTSERIVGEAIRDVRDEVVLATKVSPWHLTYRGVRRALEGSLRRLGLSYVDLYQVHWPNPVIPLGQTMRAMEDLLGEGKIRAIGVSNFSLGRLEAARGHLSRHDVASNQVEYNVLKRDVERDLLPYCEREKITLIAYSPLAQGLLTGKYGPGRMPKGLQRRVMIALRYGGSKRLARILEVLGEIARRRGVTVPQVSLNWVLRSPAVVAIPGAKREEHVRQNVGAVGWSLTQDELEAIEAALSS